uniref:Uncharacterized protein n=1 Tax=Arundo donax TaxID=35708 RepID=A0A0A8YGW1_ARUDO
MNYICVVKIYRISKGNHQQRLLRLW